QRVELRELLDLQQGTRPAPRRQRVGGRLFAHEGASSDFFWRKIGRAVSRLGSERKQRLEVPRSVPESGGAPARARVDRTRRRSAARNGKRTRSDADPAASLRGWVASDFSDRALCMTRAAEGSP